MAVPGAIKFPIQRKLHALGNKSIVAGWGMSLVWMSFTHGEHVIVSYVVPPCWSLGPVANFLHLPMWGRLYQEFSPD